MLLTSFCTMRGCDHAYQITLKYENLKYIYFGLTGNNTVSQCLQADFDMWILSLGCFTAQVNLKTQYSKHKLQ